MSQAATAARRSASLLALPHHDGSDAYVPQAPAELGDEVVVRLRVPRATGVQSVALRLVRDGEPHVVPATVDAETAADVLWRARFRMHAPLMRYRWLLAGPGLAYAWLTTAGLLRHDPTDDGDFVVSLDPGGPDWHRRGVVYEIFPDRFARSGAERTPPAWALPRRWDELPTGRGRETPHEWFGGDLGGVEAHLDHVVELGASAIYLTPIFEAGSTHRYDSRSFDHVDPLLGGDEALASLSRAAHARGVRLIGDLTLNHVGVGHDWFRTAEADPRSPERGFFWFGEHHRHGYAAWFDVRTLPVLNHTSPHLAGRLEQVVRRWLEPPFGLDGWRIDVANMAARQGASDLNLALAQAMRAALPPEALLLAEHSHDYRLDLGRGGWQGVMNYMGFLRPAWCWLRGEVPRGELAAHFLGLPVGVPRLAGVQVVETMRAYRSGMPWSGALDSWTLLDSHDTARFRTVSGSRERHLVGVGLQMTTPGVPMVFAGDELGLEGQWGEDARRTMPWQAPGSWDHTLLAGYRELIALRRASPALAEGGLRYAHVGDDAIAYLRETPDERLLCLAARAAHEPIELPLDALGGEVVPLHGGEARHADGAVHLPGDGPAFHVWRIDG